MKLISDLVADTSNIRTQNQRNEEVIENVERYFDYFYSGNWTLSEVIDSSQNLSVGLFRYFPVSYTFQEMQSSGDLGLLTENQRRLLIELSAMQEFVQIKLSRFVVLIQNEHTQRRKYWDIDHAIFSGMNRSSPDFFELTEAGNNKERRVTGLKHRNNELSHYSSMHEGMIYDGKRIIETSRRAIQTLSSGK